MEVSAVSEQALWEDVAAGLRSAITGGEYGPGATLPTEYELAGRYKVSRDTVRRALSRLTQEGLLTPGRGRLGRQVRTSKPIVFRMDRSESRERVDQRRASGTDAWVFDAREQGREGSQRISVAIEEADPEIASRLEVPDGTLVAVRRRLRTIDGEPHNIADTYYPRDISAGTAIEHPADVTQGVIALMRELGYEQVRHQYETEARMPTPDEAETLLIPPGVPVIVQYCTGYTTGRPVKVTVTVWPGDRTRLVSESPA